MSTPRGRGTGRRPSAQFAARPSRPGRPGAPGPTGPALGRRRWRMRLGVVQSRGRTIDPAAQPRRDRERWLGHPAFVACVALLVINDHVFKARFPGWWTGKLSDLAGLAVAAVVLAVLVGARRGILVAGVLFLLLKTAPGVAEAASPLLGGVTRRDPTDLVALVVLLPSWRLLRPSGHLPRPPSITRASVASVWRGAGRRCRAALSAIAPLAGAVVAAAATTATSCAPTSAVTAVASDEQALYALVQESQSSRWARSTDGGRSWRRSEPPAAAPTPATSDDDLYEDPGPTGPQEACTSDGACWRLRDRRVIERSVDGGEPIEELRLTDAEFSDISTGCTGGSIGVLASIAATEGDGVPRVVASLGAAGILVRDDGTWDRVRVLSAPPVDASGLESGAGKALVLLGPALALMVWLVGRNRWPSWRYGLLTVGMGWLTTIMTAAAASFIAGPSMEPLRIMGRVAIAGMAVTAIAAIVVARRPARPRPMLAYPQVPPPLLLPPPPPPPPTPTPTSPPEDPPPDHDGPGWHPLT